MCDSKQDKSSLCGLWADGKGKIHLAEATDAQVRSVREVDFKPWCWSLDPDTGVSATVTELEGEGPYAYLQQLESEASLKLLPKGEATLIIKPLEHQHLLTNKLRLFADLSFEQLRRLQLDIETDCSRPNGFSDPEVPEDRILAIGLRFEGENHYLCLEEDSDEAEKALLVALNERIAEWDPDTIEGHNLFKFDLHYLRTRAKRLKVPCKWGRFGQKAAFRTSRLRVAERWIDYPRCDLPGRTVVDTFFLIMLYDVTTRDLPSYTLKDVARYLGVTKEADARTYLPGDAIAREYHENRERFLAYLGDDLRETAGIADVLLPTYLAQARNFPMTLQEVLLRGTGSKIDLIFLEKYLEAEHCLPITEGIGRFEGGYTKSFETGVYHKVLHFDVASLYPSLMLSIGRNPYSDELGVFIPMLRELRQYRLQYKQLAKETEDPALAREYQARQQSFKIVINSFYGYLGFAGARFADGELAAEVTERGRNLLQQLIERFGQEDGCRVLEADTDGLYVEAPDWWDKPEELLAKVSDILPEGIELEFGDRFASMFCYKAKNYALYDGEKITIKGSALKSRGIEPFLKSLSDHLISWLLGVEERNPREVAAEVQDRIEAMEIDIHALAKKEYLSSNPETYRKAVENEGKSRRASLEVALRSEEPFRAGDQVAYFITVGEKKRMPDWQVARPLDQHDPETCPYNPDYYTKKIKDWLKRYADFLPKEQEELF